MNANGPIVLSDLPVEIDEQRLWPRLHALAGSDETARIGDTLRWAREHARPGAVYRFCSVERVDGESVMVEGVPLTGPLVLHKLPAAKRVFPFIATCGRVLDERGECAGDLLERFWWSEVCSAVMRGALRALRRDLAQRFGVSEQIPFLSPGSGDVQLWPVNEQARIFELLGDAPPRIGVSLRRSSVMIPGHSMAGLFYPGRNDFSTCRMCPRDHCPDRCHPFDAALWREVQGGE